MRYRTASLISRFLRPDTPLYVVGLVVAMLICLLTLVILWSTFFEGLPALEATYTLENYSDVILSPLTTKVALNTLILGVGTVIVASFFGFPLAWLVHRTNVPFKSLFVTLMFLSTLIPSFLRAMGWIMLLSPKVGIINQLLRLFIHIESGPLSPYNIPFMSFIQGIALTPVLFFMLAGSFSAIDPSFEESAEISGASKFQSIKSIAFPLVKPALVAGLIYIFMTGVSMFEVPALLGAPFRIHVFSTLMYESMHPPEGTVSFGIAGVYGMLLLIPTTIALYLYQRMIKLSYRYATVTGKGYRPKLTDLGQWRYAGAGFIILYYLLGLLIPFLVIVWVSFTPYIQLPSMAALGTLNLAGYQGAIRMLGEHGIVPNTIQLMVLVGIFGALIGLIISWIVLRTTLPGRYTLDTISMVPHAVPAIGFAFSIAFVALLLVKSIPIYGSLSSIILADILLVLPFTTRTINASIIQIHRDLEDAVQICGGSRVTALRTVIMPLVIPAIFYSFMFGLLFAYRDVTVALFLQTTRNTVMSTAIWTMWSAGQSAEAAALGVIMIVVMSIVVIVILRAFPQILREAEHRGL